MCRRACLCCVNLCRVQGCVFSDGAPYHTTTNCFPPISIEMKKIIKKYNNRGVHWCVLARPGYLVLQPPPTKHVKCLKAFLPWVPYRWAPCPWVLDLWPLAVAPPSHMGLLPLLMRALGPFFLLRALGPCLLLRALGPCLLLRALRVPP
jgi:hypothetical protein